MSLSKLPRPKRGPEEFLHRPRIRGHLLRCSRHTTLPSTGPVHLWDFPYYYHCECGVYYGQIGLRGITAIKLDHRRHRRELAALPETEKPKPLEGGIPL